MKKLVLIFSLVLCITGCSIEKIDTSNKDELISYMTNKKYDLYNRYSLGYKYYLPKTVSVINYSDYNEQLLSNGETYYFYIDVTSYYYKKDMRIEKDDDDIYYKKIDNDDKEGFVKVTEQDDKYYVIYQYNYARIESIINKNHLDETLINMSYILSSIKYNDTIIESIVKDSTDISREEKFELDKPNNNENSFFYYVKAYDNYNKEEEKKVDEETINTEGTGK